VIERRKFLAKASGAAVVTAATLVDAPNVIAQPKVQWRMSTAWNNRALDVHQTAEKLAKAVEEMTAGRFRIEVFPGGQIMDPYACFDAASKGKIEAFMSAPFYWADKEPAIQWFHTIPFGMNPEGMAAWFYQGDGLKLMEEAYGAFNLVPRPSGSQAPQMGGWFRKKITTLADFKGLRIRIGPLGGKVLAKAGATVTLIPAADIYAALERGVIDASEWVGPADDMQLGLHKTARYYYYPGWHEPGSTNEFGFNKKAYEALPLDLRRSLDHAAAAMQVQGLTSFHAKNASALQVLKSEYKGKVEILPFPVAVLRDLKKLAVEVIREESEKTPMAKKVHASFSKFQALVGPWDQIAEGAYHQLVAGAS
jgi:TRAP-type mannitol/chloroaromatic compound transport system substrate-binding protein